METQDVKPIRIFYTYASVDKPWRNEIERHLSSSKNSDWIVSWFDREIQPDMVWEQEIDAHLNTADIILLFISPAYMDSDYAYGLEMQRALDRHEHGEARVVPILLRPTYWEGAPFGKLHPLPTNGKPITTWLNLDRALSDVILGIREIVTTILPRRIEDRFQEKANSHDVVTIDDVWWPALSRHQNRLQ